MMSSCSLCVFYAIGVLDDAVALSKSDTAHLPVRPRSLRARSFFYEDDMLALAKLFPNVRFVHVSGSKTAPNVKQVRAAGLEVQMRTFLTSSLDGSLNPVDGYTRGWWI